MSESILSQAEIDALLKVAESPRPADSSEDKVYGVFEAIVPDLQNYLNMVFMLPAKIEGPYIETVHPSLDSFFHTDLFVIPIEIGEADLFALVSDGDVEIIAQQIGGELKRSLTVVIEECVSHLAGAVSERCGYFADSQLFPSTQIARDQVGTLPVSERSVLVRFGVVWPDTSVELSFFISGTQLNILLNPQQHRSQNKSKKKAPPKTGTPQRKQSLLKHQQFAVENAQFSSILPEGSIDSDRNINLVNDVDLDIVVELGRTRMTLLDLMDLKERSLIKLTKIAGEPMDVFINGHSVAKAEVVVLDDNFGVRIMEIVPVNDRIREK